MDVSIIIINWNTAAALRDCLASIYNNVKNISYEILVVDNGSTDGSPEMVRQNYPQARILQNQGNYGFARAANQGLRQTGGRYKLILKSDTQITSGALEELTKYLDTHPNCALAGPQLINRDETRQNSFANFPSLTGELLNRSILELLFPKKYPSKRQARNEPFSVESLVGACMIVRNEFLNRVGFLDEDYFFFLEETDWCLRIRKNGYQVAVVPAARVYHLQGETKKQDLIPAKIEYLNSLYKFFSKHKPPLSYSILRILKPLKIMLEFLMTFIALIATAGLIKKVRKKTLVYFNLALWHLLLCPERMTLKYRQKQAREPVRIHWLIKDPLLAGSLEKLEFSPELVPACPGWSFELLKNHKVKKLWRIKTSDSPDIYLLKLYRRTHPFSWLKILFYGPKAEREFNLSKRIAYRGIPTIIPNAVGISRIPRGVSYCGRNTVGVESFSILISKEIKDCSNLSHYLLTAEGMAPSPPLAGQVNQAARKKIIQSYGQLANQVHQKGIRQEDFDPNNILIQFSPPAAGSINDEFKQVHHPLVGRSKPLLGPDDTEVRTSAYPHYNCHNSGIHLFKLFLIDLERVKLGLPLSIRERIKSLAKLNRIRGRISTADRFRFLRSYLNRSPDITSGRSDRAIMKTWIQKIKEAQDLIMEQNYRWIKKISLWENRNIGRYDDEQFQGFYRKKYPQLKQNGYNYEQVSQFISYLGNSEQMPFNQVKLKIFPDYRQAKKLWQELNALLKIYRPAVLPVAVLKQKNKRAGYLLSQPLTSSFPPPPAFFLNLKIEQRLTEVKKMIK